MMPRSTCRSVSFKAIFSDPERSAFSFRFRGKQTFKTSPFFNSSFILILYSMVMNYMSVIGLLAGACTTLSFLPQAIKTFRTKETRDISLSMYIILAAGILLWIIYGMLIRDFPVILANSISFVLVSIILILKVKHG